MLTAWDQALYTHIARGKRWHELTPHAQESALRLEQMGLIRIDRSGAGRIEIIAAPSEKQAKEVQ